MERFGTFEQFIAFLQTHKVAHKSDLANLTVELVSNAAPLPGNLYIKWDRNLPLFSMIQFMMLDVPDDRVTNLEAAISRMNTVMEIGGFCFDYTTKRLLCRFPVTVFEPITPPHFQRIFDLVVMNARGFTPLFKKVVDGADGTKIEDLARELAAQVQAQKAAATPAS